MSETTTTETNTPSVQQAWARVMGDVRELGKDSRNDHQRFNFRGVDDVMNAVGPALRRHGVSVVPVAVDLRTRDAQTTQGKAAHETMVVVTYTIHGPAGDSMPGAAAGESLDSGDKATPKAMSVAYRTFLLQALCLPTMDTDPDAQSYERVEEGPTPEQQAQTVADGLPGCADAGRLAAVRQWAQDRTLLGVTVTDHEGTALPLGELFAAHAVRLQAVAA